LHDICNNAIVPESDACENSAATYFSSIDKAVSRVARYQKTFKETHMSHTINTEEIAMLRSEIELLMKERQALLKVAGTAASLIAELDSHDLPQGAVQAGELLSENINRLTEETLQDALGSVHAEIVAS
jgi:hypothetical protein